MCLDFLLLNNWSPVCKHVFQCVEIRMRAMGCWHSECKGSWLSYMHIPISRMYITTSFNWEIITPVAAVRETYLLDSQTLSAMHVLVGKIKFSIKGFWVLHIALIYFQRHLYHGSAILHCCELIHTDVKLPRPFLFCFCFHITGVVFTQSLMIYVTTVTLAWDMQ